MATLHTVSDGRARELTPEPPIARTSMPEQVRWNILARVTSGAYAPGDRLKQATLAREFNVSQGSVREALRELEALGVVESQPYRGTRIRTISEDEMREAYQVRGTLEESAARSTRTVSPHDVEFLQKTVDRMRELADAGDRPGYVRHNLEFHRRIVAMAGNRVLLRVWESLAVGMRSHFTVVRVSRRISSVAASHQAIVDAYRSRDFKLAGRLLREHAVSFVTSGG